MILLNKYKLNYIYNNTSEFCMCIAVNTSIEECENYSKGLVHFVEHIIYRRFMKILDKTKCNIYAETNNLYTYFSIKGKNNNIDLILDNIEVILNPKTVTIDEIKTEKEIIMTEKRQKEKDILYVFNKNICKENYNDVLNIIGDETDVLNVDINELNDFIENKYKQQNISISIIGDTDIFNKIKSCEYTKVSSNPVFYYNDKVFSIYFNIPGMSSHLYYIFNVIKYMILGELSKKYERLSVKIIRINKDESFFVISGYLSGITKQDVICEIVKLIYNERIFKSYLIKYSEYMIKKLKSSEFLSCITSILKLLDVYDVCKFKLYNMKLISEEDYNECKRYFVIDEIEYKMQHRDGSV